MTTNARLELVALDAPDIHALSRFYADLAGWKTVSEEDDWITMRAGDGQELAFQLAPDHVSPQWPSQEHPQQFHLDLAVADHEAAAARAVELGATRLADGASWITVADPAGHPIDLCRIEDAGEGMGIFAIAIDCPDAAALARFYGGLLGMAATYEGPEGAMIEGEGRRIMFQKVDNYNAPRWPDPAYPQQAHLDILVDDLDEGGTRALELGATSTTSGGPTYRVYTDPAGHPFCLTIGG